MYVQNNVYEKHISEKKKKEKKHKERLHSRLFFYLDLFLFYIIFVEWGKMKS